MDTSTRTLAALTLMVMSVSYTPGSIDARERMKPGWSKEATSPATVSAIWML